MDDTISIDDRMKEYEHQEAGRKLTKLLPILIRLDGRGFHNFTRGLERPYDKRLSDLMIATTTFLAQEANSVAAYTQSDEISLCLYSDNYYTQTYFDNRVCKLISILASQATLFFYRNLPQHLPICYQDRLPHFDCRVWNVPTLEEAVNAFLWREQDATKNAISMAAQANFSHNQLQGKNGKEMQEMLFKERGINFNDFPDFFKRGTYVQKRVLTTPFTAENLEKLPPKHHARTNPELVVERSEFRTIWPPKTFKNRVEFIFSGADPIGD